MVRTNRAASRRAAVAAVAVALLTVTGCSGDDGDGEKDAQPSAPATTATEPPLKTDAKIGVVSGKLDRAKRPSVKEKVTEVVEDWIDAAYAGGDYPRSDFSDAFPHFTTGAVREAQRDAGLMSNEKLADRIETVAATKSRLRIDVLAAKRKPVGATARFALTMDLSGEVNRSEKVSGRLFLTLRNGSWKVFGYDVQRGRA
jgi:hypothetical protein